MSGRQRAIAAALVVVAFGALVLAGVYSGDTSPDAPILSGSPAADGAEGEAETTVPVNPIEDWLPRAGEGSACSEPVGVDLIPGYAALLTVNGIDIPEDEMNDRQSASGTLGQFTWGPEEDCPFGTVLRPTDNEVVACIYRNEEGPENCRRIARPDPFDF